MHFMNYGEDIMLLKNYIMIYLQFQLMLFLYFFIYFRLVTFLFQAKILI